jgi:hypothetical protein
MRKQAHIEYYEVKWSKISKENSFSDRDLSDLCEYTTLEKLDVFEKYYPKLVDEFKQKLCDKKPNKS